MKMALSRLMNRWNYRLIDGNPFGMVTLYTPCFKGEHNTGYICMYIIQAHEFLIALCKKGYRG